jgi:hypothetical protein
VALYLKHGKEQYKIPSHMWRPGGVTYQIFWVSSVNLCDSEKGKYILGQEDFQKGKGWWRCWIPLLSVDLHQLPQTPPGLPWRTAVTVPYSTLLLFVEGVVDHLGFRTRGNNESLLRVLYIE